MSDVIHKELSYKIVGCFYNVRNKYGKFHKEKVYHKALEEEFSLNNIQHISKPRISIYSVTTGERLTYYEPDLLVENKIIIELKTLPFTKQDEIQQLCEYLKVTTYEVAYLVNFGENEFQHRRFIYTNDRKPFINKIRDYPTSN